jgi:hypothetical protein
MDDSELEETQGEVPEGVGPELFREHLRHVAGQHSEDGARVTLEEESLLLDDIEGVEVDPESGRSRVRLRNGVIIGSLTGAAIVAALATIRFRRRHRQ